MSTEILLGAVFGGAVLFFGNRRSRDRRTPGITFGCAAAILFLLAFFLRLYLGYSSQGFSTDMDTFKGWARVANTVGLSEIYRQDIFLDYPPGYLYVLVLLEKLRLLLKLGVESPWFTLIMKLPSLLSDLACAGALLYVAKRRQGERTALLLAGAYLFCPAVFVNSAQWGQADSFCTAILLCSVLLLYREWYLPSAVLYGFSIACKPQMMIFAPLYLFFAIRQKRWLQLGLGVAAAFGMILLTAAPFTKGFHFLWLLRKYESTLHYYDYYSVNAYNIWSLLGWNWKTLPGGAVKTALTLSAPLLATALCGTLMLCARKKEAVFSCVPVLMAVMYAAGIKMHERYLFPAFLFLLLAAACSGDRRVISAYGLVTAANYLNVAYVLYLFREKRGAYDPNEPVTRWMAVFQVLSILWMLYACFAANLSEKVWERKLAVPRPLPEFSGEGRRLCRWDLLAMAAVTLLYGACAFRDLGDREFAVTPWAPAEGESAVLEAEGPCDRLYYLPGLAPDGDHYAARVGVDFRVETSEDGETWTECGTIDSGYIFTWKQYDLETPGRWVRLTALDGRSTLNEASLKLAGKTGLARVKAREEKAAALTDEQELVPLYTTYENSAYFDEIYHARTAYEHILSLEPYENTHPPLGKYIISLGIRLFGLNPFGWRCMGTLFGVLMLPALYHLLKQLVGKTWLCTAGTLVFAFDFMHFTQTRIATIDTYAVFFLLLMYDGMVAFLRRDLLRDGWKKLLPPLFLSGLFMGLGVAAKWTAAYGAVGLAVLFFGKLFFTVLREVREGRDPEPALGKCAALCLWCCLFFVLIPFGVYFAAYVPLVTLPHNAGRIWGSFWSYQTTMFNYHSQLVAEHYFASPWYEWPLVIRPIWYFSGDPVNAQGAYGTISALGDPLFWWAGIPALLGAAVLWVRERRPVCGVLLAGFLSVYLPWVLVPRLTFIYHYFTATPFLVLALAAVFEKASETGLLARRIPVGGKTVSLSALAAGCFTAGCLVLFAVYYPVISGAPTTRAYADALELFHTWYFG